MRRCRNWSLLLWQAKATTDNTEKARIIQNWSLIRAFSVLSVVDLSSAYGWVIGGSN
jgi:hypothetical protein